MMYICMHEPVWCICVCMNLYVICMCAWACVVYVCVHEPVWCIYVCMNLYGICMYAWACVIYACVHEPVWYVHYMYEPVCYMFVCISLWRSEVNIGCHPILIFTLFFERRPLTWYVQLEAVQTGPASFSSISPCSGVTAMSHHGIWLKSSCLHTKPSQQPRNDYEAAHVANTLEYRLHAVCHAAHIPVTWALGR